MLSVLSQYSSWFGLAVWISLGKPQKASRISAYSSLLPHRSFLSSPHPPNFCMTQQVELLNINKTEGCYQNNAARALREPFID